ncbi:GTP-binding protein [Catenibacterium sp.]|uniref:GTP-binding protein n=1 Tax=Catenibacterium sp. TaxID=2049022 RepID=UPI003AF065EF
MKQLTLGMVAHVDAGKTTLSESLLYTTGTIKHQGRVDHKDTFLDYNTQERERGITIFSKVSSLDYKNNHFTFIDTPGHADFSGEMERALSVLDYAIVIINGLDGVQAHTKTIWNLLEHYHVPAFIFVNKMDLTHYTKEELLDSLSQLSPHIMDMSASEEDIVALDEEMIEEYLETGSLKDTSIAKAISNRHLYPLYFGSALKNQGVDELLDALDRYTLEKEPQTELSAQVFKITRDERGERLVFIKVTGGRLHVRDTIHDEKIHRIRLYQGNRYTLVEEASQNDIVALTGIKKLQAGDYIGLGHVIHSTLRPSMLYSIQPSKEADINHFFSSLKVLGEEEPLSIFFDKEAIKKEYTGKNDIIFLRLANTILVIVAILLILYLKDFVLDMPYIINKQYSYAEGYVTEQSHGGADISSERRSIFLYDKVKDDEIEITVFSRYIDKNTYLKVQYLPHTKYGAIVEIK